MANNIRKIWNSIIATRLESMTTEELLELNRTGALDGVAVPVGTFAPPTTSVRASAPPPHAPTGRPSMSLKEALVDVMSRAERPLTSNEIVARVIAARPGSPDPSIRSEISRARKLGVIALRGDPRGGTYTLTRAMSARA